MENERRRESSLVQKMPERLVREEEKKVEIINKRVSESCKLRVRKQPNKNAEILGVLEPNQAVEVLEEKRGWSTIKYNNVTGYAMSQFLIG